MVWVKEDVKVNIDQKSTDSKRGIVYKKKMSKIAKFKYINISEQPLQIL